MLEVPVLVDVGDLVAVLVSRADLLTKGVLVDD
jgi:hypothetical protein